MLGVEQVAIEGKTLRGSGSSHLGPLPLVSAWATKNHLTLSPVAVEEGSNEITAIPKLLELLDLHGALVSLKAIGGPKEIAEAVRAGGGRYVLTVQENQPHRLTDIRPYFREALETNDAEMDHDTSETEEHGHGR